MAGLVGASAGAACMGTLAAGDYYADYFGARSIVGGGQGASSHHATAATAGAGGMAAVTSISHAAGAIDPVAAEVAAADARGASLPAFASSLKAFLTTAPAANLAKCLPPPARRLLLPVLSSFLGAFPAPQQLMGQALTLAKQLCDRDVASAAGWHVRLRAGRLAGSSATVGPADTKLVIPGNIRGDSLGRAGATAHLAGCTSVPALLTRETAWAGLCLATAAQQRAEVTGAVLRAMRAAAGVSPTPVEVLRAAVAFPKAAAGAKASGASAAAGAGGGGAGGKRTRRREGPAAGAVDADLTEEDAAAARAAAAAAAAEEEAQEEQAVAAAEDEGPVLLEEGSVSAAAAPTPGELLPLLGVSGLLSPLEHVREDSLRSLDPVLAAHRVPESLDGLPPAERSAWLMLLSRLYTFIHDESDATAEVAEALWERSDPSLDVLGEAVPAMLHLLRHRELRLRRAASKAVVAALEELAEAEEEAEAGDDEVAVPVPERVREVLRTAIGLYLSAPCGRTTAPKKKKPKKSKKKGVPAAPVQQAPPIPQEELERNEHGSFVRQGCMRVIQHASRAGLVDVADTTALLAFVIRHGLGDPALRVRVATLDAGRAVVAVAAERDPVEVLDILERFLDGRGPVFDALRGDDVDRVRDMQREGAVVLLGEAARYLRKGDAKIAGTVDTLLETLRAPSEPVQKAVAKCLPPLAKSLKEQSGRVVEGLLDLLVTGETKSTRRGAAHGLAGSIKGFGLAALKAGGVVDRLEEAAVNKRMPGARQGAMFAIECLVSNLGILFEPYIVRLLPTLLGSYADDELDVRSAAGAAGRAVMRNLSGHGVRLVLPALLAGLEDKQWRTKRAATQLLGAMAYCAPRQLASALPEIVPHLCNTFKDAHKKVSGAGEEALNDIGKVIRNPEISAIAPDLLAGLADPANQTTGALAALGSTSFVHAIDAPSLALIVPILLRAMRDRSAATKRTALVIVGSMCRLVAEPRTLLPYVDQLLPELRRLVVDPIPEVRQSAGRALGGLVTEVGEERCAGIVDWLAVTLQSPKTSVERSGGAGGLCEVLISLGEPRMSEVLLPLLALGSAGRPESREGLLWLLTFLPSTMGAGFVPYLADTFPIVMAGLADDNEAVREVAVKAGQVIVRGMGATQTSEVVPPIIAGLKADAWRIRQATIRLLGELIVAISGVELQVAADPFGNDGLGAEEGDSDESGDDSDFDSDDEDGDERRRRGGGKKRRDKGEEEAAAGAGGEQVPGHVGADAMAMPGQGGGDGNFNASGRKVSVQAALSKSDMSRVEAQVLAVLGAEQRDDMFASLYLLRSDASHVVKHAAVTAWKSIAGQSPHLLRHILPALMRLVLEGLAGEAEERRAVASKSLGELVKRMPERVIAEVAPRLQEALASGDVPERRGACTGLEQLILSGGKRLMSSHTGVVVPAVRDALCDADGGVRYAAAAAFDSLHRVIGQQAIDEVIPALLTQLTEGHVAAAEHQAAVAAAGEGAEEPEAPAAVAAGARAMLGLQNLLVLRGRELLPYLLPTLLTRPVDEHKLKALASVCAVTGEYVHLHFRQVIPAIVGALSGTDKHGASGGKRGKGAGSGISEADEELAQEAWERLQGPLGASARDVVLAVQQPGLQWLLEALVGFVSTHVPAQRTVAVWLLGELAAGTECDMHDHLGLVIKELVARLDDTSQTVLVANNKAIKALLSSTEPAEMYGQIAFMRNCIVSLISDKRLRKSLMQQGTGPVLLPGLCLPKAVDPFLPLFRKALMDAPPQVREVAALSIGDLIGAADVKLLRSTLTRICGPLVRAAGEKLPPRTRGSIITTLMTITAKGGMALRAMFPQMQTTFVKALKDEDKSLHGKAAAALGELMQLSPRVSALVNELCTGFETADLPSVRESMAGALRSVVETAAHKLSDVVLERARDVMTSGLSDRDHRVRGLAARATACILNALPAEEAAAEALSLAQQVSDEDRPAAEQAASATALGFAALRSATDAQATWQCPLAVVAALEGAALGNDDEEVRAQASIALALCLPKPAGGAAQAEEAAAAGGGGCADAAEARAQAMAALAAVVAQEKSSDVRGAVAVSLKTLAKRVQTDSQVVDHPAVAAGLVQLLGKLANDSNQAVKRRAGRAGLHLLATHNEERAAVLAGAVAAAAGDAAGKAATDYAKRNRKRVIADDSDGEDEWKV